MVPLSAPYERNRGDIMSTINTQTSDRGKALQLQALLSAHTHAHALASPSCPAGLMHARHRVPRAAVTLAVLAGLALPAVLSAPAAAWASPEDAPAATAASATATPAVAPAAPAGSDTAAPAAPSAKPASLLDEKALDAKIAAMGSVAEVSNKIAAGQLSQADQLALLQRALVKRAGYSELLAWSTQSAAHADFLQWFLNDYTTFNLFMTGGAPGTRSNQGSKESYARALTQLKDLRAAYGDDITDKTPEADRAVYRKMMVSAALGMSPDTHFWAGNSKNPANPVKRYGIIKTFRAHADRYQFRKDIFDNLPVEFMRWVFENRISDEELPWLANYTLNQRDDAGKPLEPGKRLGAYTYTYTDSKEGVHFAWDNPTFYNKHDIEQQATTLSRPASPNYQPQNVPGGWRSLYQFTYNDPNFPNAKPTDPFYLSYADMTPEQVKAMAAKGELPIRLWMVFQRGGVCGAIAKTFENLNGIAGVPSTVHGQPGHATAVTMTLRENPETHKTEPQWIIQNNSTNVPGYGWLELQIPEANHKPCGWEEVHEQRDDEATSGHMWRRWGGGPYLLLAQDAVSNLDAFTKVLLLRTLADTQASDADKLVAVNKAVEVQGVNQDALLDKVELLKRTGAADQEWLKLAGQVVEGYKNHPLPLHSMMKLIIQKGGEQLRGPVEAMRITALQRASKTQDADAPMAIEIRSTADCLLGRKDAKVATFSFSGEDAGKIKLGVQLAGITTAWQYSLDGGSSWIDVAAGQHEVQLSGDQLARINETNDIKVRMAGVPDAGVSTIDIVVSPEPQRVFVNDQANTVYTKDIAENPANAANYEALVKGRWVKLSEAAPFEGDCEVAIRAAAHDNALPSTRSFVARFTSNEPGLKLVPYNELRVNSFSSSQQGEGGAKTVINGWVAPDSNDGEFWHNTWGGERDPWITIDLGRTRSLKAVDFWKRTKGGGGVPGGSLKVLIAPDNGAPVDAEQPQAPAPDQFKEVKTFNVGSADTPWDGARVRLGFDQPVAGRYVKILRPSATPDQKQLLSCQQLDFFEAV